MIPIHLFIAGAAAALVAGALAGWTVRDWRADAHSFDALQDAISKAEKIQTDGLAQAKVYAGFSQGNVEKTVIEQNRLREIYHEVKVPVDCAVPADAVSVLEDGRRRANSAVAGELGSGLPAATGATEPAR